MGEILVEARKLLAEEEKRLDNEKLEEQLNDMDSPNEMGYVCTISATYTHLFEEKPINPGILALIHKSKGKIKWGGIRLGVYYATVYVEYPSNIAGTELSVAIDFHYNQEYIGTIKPTTIPETHEALEKYIQGILVSLNRLG